MWVGNLFSTQIFIKETNMIEQDIFSVYKDEDRTKTHLKQLFFSISPPIQGDGAIHQSVNVDSADYNDSHNLDNMGFGGRSSTAYSSSDIYNLESKRKINLYREILRYPEVDNVVNQIVADAIVYDSKKRFVHLNLDDTNFTPKIKKMILDEFDNVLKLYKSKQHAMRHFKKYYVDSKIFFHKVIDPDNPSLGILEMRELDPRLINLHRKNMYTQDAYGNDIWVGYEDLFVYENPIIHNQQGYDFTYASMGGSNQQEIPRSAITYAHSGLIDCKDQIIGHLHQAIKPAHTLKMLEDAMVINRVVRAPDRKVFYIDTGKATSEQAKTMMQDLRRSHSNGTIYDTETGKFDGYKNQMLVTDDYWLQRQEGRDNVKIETLPGASGMNEIEDIKWQNKKLYEALKIPLSRMPNEAQVVFGDDGGTGRDERMFQKFIDQTVGFYSEIFLDPLMTNLVLKGIITLEEWLDNCEDIVVKYNKDEYFTEIAELEINERRYDLLERVEQYRGKYTSGRRVMKEILKYSDEDIDMVFDEILEERQNIIFNPPIKVDQYGKPVSANEIGTYSTEVEQIIPPELDANIQNQREQMANNVNESISFSVFK